MVFWPNGSYVNHGMRGVWTAVAIILASAGTIWPAVIGAFSWRPPSALRLLAAGTSVLSVGFLYLVVASYT
jgi:hypothetical protein